jgi:phosphoesterase RecJ-like protein
MFECEVKELVAKIKAAESIAIIGHKNSDMDSMGAMLGLSRIIEINFGKKPICLYDGNVPAYQDFLPGRSDIVYVGKLPETFHADLLICVDIADSNKQFGDFKLDVFSRSDFVTKIDHHPDSEKFGAINIDDETASAAAEIIYDMANTAGWKIDVDAATCLLAGIVFDTGTFKWVQNSAPLRACADLVDLGASLDMILEKMNSAPKKHILACGRAVANAEFYKNLAIAIIPREDYKNLDGSAAEVLDILRRIPGIEYFVLLTQAHEDSIHISMRGRTKAVNEIAANCFSGGGHKLAAGGIFQGSLEDAKKAVIDAFSGC